MREIIMAYQGEMSLKGQNRKSFEKTLMATLRRRLKDVGLCKVYVAQSTFYIEPQEGVDAGAVFETVREVFGLAALSRACICEKDFEEITKTAMTYLREELETAKTFKVVARRADKNFPMNSMEIAAELGHQLLEAFENLSVDIKNPELTVMVEVRDFGAYVHSGKKPGLGGLPVSTSGKAAVMLSGGIDSPVAAYMMAKRGMRLMAVHFASPPYTSLRATMKVVRLCEEIAPYAGDFSLQVIPFTDVQLHIKDRSPSPLFTVLLRRSMMRITQALGEMYGCEAIVTGESLAQVASQTVQALACTNAAVDMPVLRPLIGMDKNEITIRAQQIGTYETSILPYEDCCTIFTPAHPKTKPKMEEILRAEQGMDLAPLEAAAVEGAQKLRIYWNGTSDELPAPTF
ncbi:tRNA 4-thiouridine(8) synthase ThiI [Ruminococcaceae bacterium OttesenSCG-928-N02]|nr:tRNA 4-thiouridine(8) synthase ThiI [Ruminococcaceae bacterium OttesenSCG-928-N02]